jgi:ankyrin repeat protein
VIYLEYEILFIREPLSLKLRFKGETPLHLASRKGYEKIVQILVEMNAELDVRNKAGITPLGLACIHGNTKIVKYLLKNGASPDISDKARSTPLHVATTNGYLDIVKCLLSSKKGLLTINNVDEDHQTAIFVACAQGHWKIVEYLIFKGADYKICDRQGTTCNLLVQNRGNQKIFKR